MVQARSSIFPYRMDDVHPGLLVFGIGNRSRGDDALGPLLLDGIKNALGQGFPVEFQEVYQLQIEHTLDMQRFPEVWFLDAAQGVREAFCFGPVIPAKAEDIVFSHAMTPAMLQLVYQRVFGGELMPECFQMAVSGDEFELGAPLSPIAEQHLDLALAFLLDRLRGHSIHP